MTAYTRSCMKCMIAAMHAAYRPAEVVQRGPCRTEMRTTHTILACAQGLNPGEVMVWSSLSTINTQFSNYVTAATVQVRRCGYKLQDTEVVCEHS